LLLEHVPRLQFCVETSDAVNPSVFLVPAATVPKPDTGENIFWEAILCFLTGNRLAKIERLTMKTTLKTHLFDSLQKPQKKTFFFRDETSLFSVERMLLTRIFRKLFLLEPIRFTII